MVNSDGDEDSRRSRCDAATFQRLAGQSVHGGYSRGERTRLVGETESCEFQMRICRYDIA